MNKVILMGRLTRDPEVRYSQGERQMEIARYTLAVDRPRRQNQEGGQTADFISCVAFDKAAAFAEKYLHRGTKIIVEGHIRTGSYTNKDGQKVYTTEVIVDSHEFAESRKAAAENGFPAESVIDARQADIQRAKEASGPRAVQESFMDIPDNIEDEGLPFN